MPATCCDGYHKTFMKEHILDGHIVAVSPDAKEEPAFLRQMATVIAVSRHKGALLVHVSFDEKSFGAFEPKDLLILKPPKMLRDSITGAEGAMSAEERKLADKIVKLLELEEEKVAFRYAMSSKKMQALCLTNCLDWIKQQDLANKKGRRIR